MSDESKNVGNNSDEDCSGLESAKLFDDQLATKGCEDNPELAHRCILSSMMIRLIAKMLSMIVSHEILKGDFNITEQFAQIYRKKKNIHKFIDLGSEEMMRDFDSASTFMSEFGMSLQQIKAEYTVLFYLNRPFLG